MQGLTTRDLYPTIGSQGAVLECKLMLLQHNEENQKRCDKGYGKKSDFRCRRKLEYLEKT